MILDLQDLSTAQKQNWLQHAIAPRPIGLVSTIDQEGRPNLAPFSFFNMVSSNPPLVIFSPARRVRDNTTKHSFENLHHVKEAVIHIVTYEMVQQASLASSDYPAGIDEFMKAGFTKEPAKLVTPPMVKESPIKLECKINQMQPLGKEGGAGNLVIAEVLFMHIDEQILNNEGTMIDQLKLHHVARLGADWYCKVDYENLFTVSKPGMHPGIGMDMLPDFIRNSEILTGNDLARLASIESLPVFDPEFTNSRVRSIIYHCRHSRHLLHKELCEYAIELLNKNELQKAWQVMGKLQMVNNHVT